MILANSGKISKETITHLHNPHTRQPNVKIIHMNKYLTDDSCLKVTHSGQETEKEKLQKPPISPNGFRVTQNST